MKQKINNWKRYVLVGSFLFLFGINLYAFRSHIEKGRLTQGTYQTGTGNNVMYIIADGKGNILRYNQVEGINWRGKYNYVNEMIYHLELEDGDSCDILYDSNKIFLFDKQTGEISIYEKKSSALMMMDINKNNWPKWCMP